ncbi:AAA family ATPase [Bradyrhizobium sp. CCGUVB23]|uniref:AAA family ATPase n=1 Tax=Bradyrhizobium sp. CCGUVB23 TaxID=2949630 RepID=UPI0020B3D0A2|nr:AAA family ATPase [Bradyrhizobium sp. CCGUVB23]MCP3468421.1 AAA family ATPase [Bradyrhizobium sp. CCGUVB23]
MSGWFLECLEVEGFRGINNEGDPLVLNFTHDAVNSVSAPNGVGKSSIFDALTYALRKRIPKLDELPASEGGDGYYLNRFHSKSTGTIKLTVHPDGAGKPVTISITRDVAGARKVSAPKGVDGEKLLASLNRDFVLLDHKTLQSFIDDKALERGRAFAGLLGLAAYSALRQELQALSNTRAFNNHFDVKALNQQDTSLKATIIKQQAEAVSAFQALTQTSLLDQKDHAAAVLKAHNALHQIAILNPHCTGKLFGEIVIDDCVEAIKKAEGGDAPARLAGLQRQETMIASRISVGPSDDNFKKLLSLATERDQAMSQTAGKLLKALYAASRAVLCDDSWPNKNQCPACEQESAGSLLPGLEARLAAFQELEDCTAKLETEWKGGGWGELRKLEEAHAEGGDQLMFAALGKRAELALTESEVRDLWAWRSTLLERAAAALQDTKTKREALEKELPASLVAVTSAVEAARRLQKAWKDVLDAQAGLAKVTSKLAAINRIKGFLDKASDTFAAAEADLSKRRLAAVEPLCQKFFGSIMYEPVKPSLAKADGAEALSIGLSQFFTLRNVSAQALLSESFRNAFAVSVYLAAATLYGGEPRFIVLDDVTSSFDAGHQFHLMELIRTQFARPMQANGPQVILLSHDTLVEKLFNRNNGQSWKHQRLEGTARTAVLPQSDAVNRVRDATLRFLQAGQVDDAAPRLRQYLEHRLLDVIQKVKIPVPIDFALDDNNKQVGNASAAIEAAVKLHKAAGILVLDAAQEAGLQTHMASITGNFVAHFATGSTSAFSSGSLLGVMQAIDEYAECFMYEDPPGGGTKKFYRSLSKR